jgi:hypothetical protein
LKTSPRFSNDDKAPESVNNAAFEAHTTAFVVADVSEITKESIKENSKRKLNAMQDYIDVLRDDLELRRKEIMLSEQKLKQQKEMHDDNFILRIFQQNPDSEESKQYFDLQRKLQWQKFYENLPDE